MTFPWHQVAQFAVSFGGDSCLLRFSDGTAKEISQQANAWVEASGEPVALQASQSTLRESIAKDVLKDLAQIFSQKPWLDAIELREGDTLVLRLVRDTSSVLPMAQLVVSGEQSFSTEVLIPSKKVPKEISPSEYSAVLRELSQPLYAVEREGRVVLTQERSSEVLTGVIPAMLPEQLGSSVFRRSHGLRYAYVVGAMAGGIASVDLVVSMAKAGYMGFFGAGGLPLSKVEEALAETKQRLQPGEPFGFNLLHNPFEPAVEEATVALYLKYGVRCIDASAYMGLTPALVWYRFKGIHQTSSGIVCPNRVFAKVSRAEIGSVFLAPPSASLLQELVTQGRLTQEEARLAQFLPVADGVTAEADSGGHTDRRPLSVLIPLMLQVRDQAMGKYGYHKLGIDIQVGAAGGVAEPLSAKAALSLGAGYLMTGSLNQSALEAGTSSLVKRMLSEADMADVAMAPAPDMFEMGVQVQVLKRGTLYAQRAQKLYEIYKGFASIEEIPTAEREKLEKQLFRRPLQEVWQETEGYWQARDPKEAEKARQDGKHKMALCFRWYLGMSSRWGRIGEEGRKLDFQIWCGPAMGAFNRWAKGSSLEKLEGRSAPKMAESILRGTAALVRLEAAQLAGVLGLPSVIEVSRPYE
jgi:trans-AT polyketide synthase, acyltransferase and oxidoreductase domains